MPNRDQKSEVRNQKSENQWYQITAKKDNAEILIYEQIGKGWDDSGVGAKKFVEDLQALDVSNIDLHINSPGGNVFEGNAIYNALKAHKAKINVTIDGVAASIASVIAMSGDKIEMPENAMMMLHDPSGLVIGTAKDMRKMATAMNKIKTGLVAAYHNKTGMERDEISVMMEDETWMTAQEAVEMGFADEMLEPVEIQANMKMLGQYQYKNVPKQLEITNSSKSIKTKKEKKTMDLKELTAEYPDLVTQIREEGVKSVDLAAAKNEAVQTEKERILGLAKIQFGEETSKKFEAIVESNVTVAQFEAVSAINPAPEPEKADTQAAMLEAIHKAGAENPGANAGEAGEGGSGKDYMSQVNEHKLLMKCSTTDAMQAVMKKDPAAHEAYLASVN